MKKKLKGDHFKISITPPSTSFPWIQIFRHDYGVREKGEEVGGINATKSTSREELARLIGEMVIDNSKILKAWLKKHSDEAAKPKPS